MKRKIFAPIMAGVLSVIISVSLAACGNPEPDIPAASVTNRGYTGKVNGVTFSLPDLGDSVSQHTELQAAYLADDYLNIANYANGVNNNQELSRPLPVTFTWEASGMGESYTLHLSERRDMSEAVAFETSETSLDVYNLKIATTYYWTVSAGEATSGIAVFTTDDTTPRNLYVDGVANVRDVGGWWTEDGYRSTQGLLYRCGALNTSNTSNTKPTITEAGIDVMLNTMKVKTEIDLRSDKSESGGITESVLGDTVTYRHIAMSWNGNLFTINKAAIRDVFTVLAEKESYPVIFHCRIGTDRTGIIAYLVNGLLGVPEEDIFRDYLFSNFGYIESARSLDNVKDDYVKSIHEFDGVSLQEKVRSALYSIGVTYEQMDSVYEILTSQN